MPGGRSAVGRNQRRHTGSRIWVRSLSAGGERSTFEQPIYVGKAVPKYARIEPALCWREVVDAEATAGHATLAHPPPVTFFEWPASFCAQFRKHCILSASSFLQQSSITLATIRESSSGSKRSRLNGLNTQMITIEDLWQYREGKRPVILHQHIYKNAGTTIDGILQREFGVFFSTLNCDDPNMTISNDEILSFLDSHPTILALSSHQIRYPKPTSDNIEFFDLCFLRHPIDRLFSQYSFLRKPHVDDPLTRVARNTDLAGFLSHVLDYHPEYACNPQAKLLLPESPSGVIGCNDVEAARALLRQISLLGVVEAFDESLVIAEYALYPYFPRLQLHYIPQNVTNSQQMTFDQRADEIRSRCGERLYERLLEANHLDIVVWSEALVDIARRLQSRPEHECWVQEFRHRTEIYQGRPRLRDRLLQWMKIPVGSSPTIQRIKG